MDDPELERLRTKEVGTFVPLTTPLVVYNATAFSTVGASTEIGAATLGTPAAAKALIVQISARDSGGTNKYFAVGPSSTCWYAVIGRNAVAAINGEANGVCPTSASGSVWYQTSASGAGTLTVTMRIWGYYL